MTKQEFIAGTRIVLASEHENVSVSEERSKNAFSEDKTSEVGSWKRKAKEFWEEWKDDIITIPAAILFGAGMAVGLWEVMNSTAPSFIKQMLLTMGGITGLIMCYILYLSLETIYYRIGYKYLNMSTIIRIVDACIRVIVRLILAFDRKVVKRFFGIETPLYKLWWEEHVKFTQRKLDAVRALREKTNLVYNA